MPSYFTHYWSNKEWNYMQSNHSPDELLSHTAGNLPRGCNVYPGDIMYVVTIKSGQLYLLGKLEVEKICDVHGAAADLEGDPDSLWAGKDHIIASSATTMDFNRTVPSEVIEQLTFITNSGPTFPKFKSPGVLDRQTLRHIRRLTPESATILDKILPPMSQRNQEDAEMMIEQDIDSLQAEEASPEEDSKKQRLPNMRPGQTAKSLWGDKLYQERARKALPILVRQALANQPISYASLAYELDMPNPRNLNYVLSSIGQTLQEISAEWSEDIPPINCLVVNKNTGLPGEGVGEFINDFGKLPRKQQRAIIAVELHKIYAYPRWRDVLKYLGLEYKSNRDYSLLLKASSSRHYGSGESSSHKKFKEYISRNPQILGLPKNLGYGELERNLPSGDVVDVLFVHGNNWIVAEAKSKISDTADIYRGLYQCVKYQAVVEAFQCEEGLQPSCQAVLVVEGEFPDELVELKNLLGIEVIQKVSL